MVNNTDLRISIFFGKEINITNKYYGYYEKNLFKEKIVFMIDCSAQN